MCQVRPSGIAPFYQFDLPRPYPPFYLLFAGNRISDVSKLLEVDQPGNAVLLGKPRDEALFVFTHARPRSFVTPVYSSTPAASLTPPSCSLPLFTKASALVILSAAGAKDLLLRFSLLALPAEQQVLRYAR